MKLFLCFLFAFCLFGCATNAGSVRKDAVNIAGSGVPAPPTPEESHQGKGDVIHKWEGNAGKVHYDWDSKDLWMRVANGKREGIFSTIARDRIKSVSASQSTKDCSASFSFRPLAIVGTTVSAELESGLSCGASSTSEWQFVSLNLAKEGRLSVPPSEQAVSRNGTKLVALNEIFQESEILKAFLTNPRISREVTKGIKDGRIRRAPSTIAEFKIFTKYLSGTFDDNFYFEANFLTRFAFHHMEGENVAIWVSLTPSSHAAQAERDHVEILLPIPDNLQSYLSLASSRTEGFLMRDAEDIVGTSYASFDLGG